MKMLLLLLFPYISFSQHGQNIFGVFKDNCSIWTDNTNNAKISGKAYLGDSCIIIKFIPTISGSDWCAVATSNTMGYAMCSFINIASEDLQILKTTSYDGARESAARLFIQNNWQAARSKRLAEIKARADSITQDEKLWKEQMEKMRRELTKYTLLLDKSTVSNNILGYPDYEVSIYNCSKRTIKYIWFNITLYNPVDDAVKKCTLKDVGPINPFKSGDYKFETIALSKVVEYSKVNSIKIEYMDGVTLTIMGAQVLSNTKLGNAIIDKYVEYLKQ
jgi:hypothetical protein